MIIILCLDFLACVHAHGDQGSMLGISSQELPTLLGFVCLFLGQGLLTDLPGTH